MSDANHSAPSNFVARDIGMVAADWIQRRDFDNWTEIDEKALQAWLDESPAHQVAFLRLDCGWQRASRLSALRSPDRFQRREQKSISPWVVRATCAAFAIGALITGANWLSSELSRTTFATPVGAHEILTLKDGSQIELNTDTVLQISKSGPTREVWLEKGEAYFQIVHDPAHPFIVNAGKRRITDIGTKFVVRYSEQKLRVAVMEGGVEFDLSSDDERSHRHQLIAGDVAIANAASVSVFKVAPDMIADETGWRRGVIVFHRTSLAEAAAQINRYGGKKLIIANARIGKLVIGGTFPINNVLALAEAAQDSFGVHVENRPDAIVLSH